MKVGDYARTEDGISKCIKVIPIRENSFMYEFDKEVYEDVNYLTASELEKYKSSPNIIDLIEVGDLVRIETEKDDTNIFEVVAINYNDGELGVFNNNFEFDWASIEQLKSIVTKEQFEAMEYKCE